MNDAMKVTHQIETYTSAGDPVLRFRVMNRSGAYMEFSNWGARWISAFVPDARGTLGNVLVGYRDLAGYLTDTYYMGAVIGRFANRISNASFVIAGKTYSLEANDGKNTNHGGPSGFHAHLWEWEELSDGIRFSLYSPDGEGGYPGNVSVSVDYRFSEENTLSVFYRAETDKATYINMTNHAYFNLSGTGERITEHRLCIPSDRMLDTTPDFIPTGKILAVSGAPFDFTSPRRIGDVIDTDDRQLHWNRGFNHTYILKEGKSDSVVLRAASLLHPETGRLLVVWTDLPAVLLYTAGFYEYPDTAVCLETQFYPDTPSHAHFPSCLLCPGDIYEHRTLFCFHHE